MIRLGLKKLAFSVSIWLAVADVNLNFSSAKRRYEIRFAQESLGTKTSFNFPTSVGPRVKKLRTMFSSSLADIGLISKLDFFASDKKSGSFIVATKAFCSSLTRSFGVPGGSE